jgi:uncharacterized membrane protein YphA (DoxX/SURF4 family)
VSNRRRPLQATARPAASARARQAVAPAAAASTQADALTTRAAELAAEWAPTAGRVLLGLVLAWFGYHELVRPGLWTGYVPVVNAHSTLATVLVLAHGWLLLMLAVALVAGILPRAAAALTAVLLLQIVITLSVTGGLSDLTLRDVGVLGLAIGLTGATRQRLRLTS